jgi:hypothetical protein
VIALSDSEIDYSDYRQLIGNLSNFLTLLSGFTFTAITILLSQFPILGSLTSQFILFIISFLFFFLILMLMHTHALLARFCRNFPPVTKDIAGYNRLLALSYILIQLAVVLMFLIWNLVYLSLATGVMWALFMVIYIRSVKRFGRFSYGKDSKT